VAQGKALTPADFPSVQDFLDSPEFEHTLTRDDGSAAAAHLAAGRVVYYGDLEHPGLMVKEYPDGRRQLIKVALGGAETLVRDLA
jgi:hypothetical protein